MSHVSSEPTDPKAAIRSAVTVRSAGFREELKVQQCEVLTDGDAVLIAQEVASDGGDEGLPREGEEGVDPLCCHLDVFHLRPRS